MKKRILIFGTLITMLLFSGCGDEGSDNRQSGIFGMIKGSSDEAPAAARKLDGSEPQIVYPLTRTITKYQKPMYDAFDGDGHRLVILSVQNPNEPKGNIFVRVSVIPDNPGVNTIYSNRPVRIGYPGHVHITEGQSTWSPGPLKRDTFDCEIHYTNEFGSLTFKAHSRIGENAYLDIDVGGKTYKVALIDS